MLHPDPIALFVLITTMVLAACGGPQDPAVQETMVTPKAPATQEITVEHDDPAEREVVVAPHRAECVGVAPMECLVVDGELFYGEIEGFQHEAGYVYRLRIERYDPWPDMEEPPADASEYGYRLIEVVSKELAD